MTDPTPAQTLASAAIKRLTDEELGELVFSLLQNVDPRPLAGFAKVRLLFTEQDSDGSPRPHRDIQDMFQREVRERLEFLQNRSES